MISASEYILIVIDMILFRDIAFKLFNYASYHSGIRKTNNIMQLQMCILSLYLRTEYGRTRIRTFTVIIVRTYRSLRPFKGGIKNILVLEKLFVLSTFYFMCIVQEPDALKLID